MNFTVDIAAIATVTTRDASLAPHSLLNCESEQYVAQTELDTYQEVQAQAVTPEGIRVRTPQRKAKYHDKTRIRKANIKAIALRETRCHDAAEMKQRLKKLGINLDLRLTAAWIAIAWELKERIAKLWESPSPAQLLQAARLDGTVAYWHEDEEEKGIFYVWKPNSPKPDLVTSTWLPMFLRKLGTAA